MTEHARAIILYGPPASGKNTITRELAQLDSRYCLFRRLKCGPGRTAGYRVISEADLAEISERDGEVIWATRRYGAVYIVDRSHLAHLLSLGRVPVLHLGQRDGVRAVTAAVPAARVLVVALTCPRDIAARRIEARHTGDTADRLNAYDETKPLPQADISLDTSLVAASHAAAMIDQAVLALR